MNQPHDAPSAPPPPSPNAPQPSKDGRGHAGIGVALALLAQILTLLFAFLSTLIGRNGDYLWIIILAVFGLVQWLYIVPIGITLHVMGKPRTAMGLWITAGVLFLINAGCWGLLAIGNW